MLMSELFVVGLDDDEKTHSEPRKSAIKKMGNGTY